MPPRTIGLTMSPPGVATAAKIAMTRITIRRDARSRSDVAMPDPRQAVQDDRELHHEAEGEEHRRDEVEVRAGGERSATRYSSVN